MDPLKTTQSSKVSSAWSLVLVLCLAMIVSVIDRFALALVIDPIRAQFGVTDQQIGALQGLAFGLFYAVLGIPCGWLADRWSRRGTILLGLVIWGCATAACGLVHSFSGLLIARMLVGAGEAALAPAAYAIIHERFAAGKQNAPLSVFQVGAVIGAGSSFYIVGGLYDWLKAHGGINAMGLGSLAPWQLTFLAVALPAILLIPVLWWVLGSNVRDEETTVAQNETHALSASHGGGAFSYMKGDWKFVTTLFIGMGGILTVNYTLLSWVPTMFVREFGWTPGQVGRPYGLIVLFSCGFSMLVAGMLADRVQRKRGPTAVILIPAFGALAALPTAAFLHFAHSPLAIFCSVAVLHALCCCAVGIAPALIQTRTPKPIRSRVSSVYVLVVNICGLSISPMLVGITVSMLPTGGGALRTAVSIVGVGGALTSCILFFAFILKQMRAQQALRNNFDGLQAVPQRND
ncbi:major facilitator transporter [Caballeronia hypogeia]|uniref:Major facilitator transporter n=1 Tax=Caballeronia hypogeia TaxID=1777140 RepID=A0A158CIX2_9BURK|nr:MFS transporter [Caballeronia hypogeia]SAK82313.1 major facilitator transporter [Caballeronia hypogeia]